jgi:hypothetical protein
VVRWSEKHFGIIFISFLSNFVAGFSFGSSSASASFNAPGTAGGFGSTSFGQNNAAGFQLSKPPVGNKRGKKA